MAEPKLLSDPTHFLFFTGKGGVGKTSLSCAVLLNLADRGKRVLLVSTDPASNVDEMLGVTLGDHPTPSLPQEWRDAAALPAMQNQLRCAIRIATFFLIDLVQV